MIGADIDLYREFIANFTIGIYRADTEGKILIANKAVLAIIGLKSNEETKFEDIPINSFPPSLHNKRTRELLEKNGEIKGIETAWKHSSGAILYLRENIKTIRDKNGKTVCYEGTVENISEKMHSAENLRKLSQAVEQSPVSIIVTDLSGKIEYVNPKACQSSGYSFLELYGSNTRILKSGDFSDIDYKQMWEKISSGDVWRGVFHNRKKSGELYWESASIAPVIDADGSITHFVAVKEDITEKRAYEESLIKSEEKYRILAEELGKTNATKDKLFSIIAHDLRGPIGNFNQILELYSALNGSDENLKKSLMGELKKESDIIYEMLENLLYWSRIQQDAISIDPVHFSFGELLSDTINLYRARAEHKKIEIICRVDEGIITFADKESISLVIRNLLSNAIKFTPKNGKVTISLNKYSDTVEFSVADTGTGVKEEVFKKLFTDNDFYRSYGTDGEKGRGIGLVLCKYFVEINNGRIRLESLSGQGSRFSVTLPIK